MIYANFPNMTLPLLSGFNGANGAPSGLGMGGGDCLATMGAFNFSSLPPASAAAITGALVAATVDDCSPADGGFASWDVGGSVVSVALLLEFVGLAASFVLPEVLEVSPPEAPVVDWAEDDCDDCWAKECPWKRARRKKLNKCSRPGDIWSLTLLKCGMWHILNK
jgi:hypothetical protein